MHQWAVEWTDGASISFRSFPDELAGAMFAQEAAAGGFVARLVVLRDRRVVLRTYGDPGVFAVALGNDPRLADSEFGRNPEMWPVLVKELVGRAPVGVWMAACSTGEEPYTLAMWLDHLAPDADVNIVASDIDADALAFARSATYPPSSVTPARGVPLAQFMAVADAGTWTAGPARRIQRSGGTIPDSFLADYFEEGEVVERIRARVTFLEPSDLLADPWPPHDVLIVRNVGLDVGLAGLAKLIQERRPSMVVVGNVEMQMGLRIDGYRWGHSPYPHFFTRG